MAKARQVRGQSHQILSSRCPRAKSWYTNLSTPQAAEIEGLIGQLGLTRVYVKTMQESYLRFTIPALESLH
jgi:hypothetical protein